MSVTYAIVLYVRRKTEINNSGDAAKIKTATTALNNAVTAAKKTTPTTPTKTTKKATTVKFKTIKKPIKLKHPRSNEKVVIA